MLTMPITRLNLAVRLLKTFRKYNKNANMAENDVL
jgi:hypothetical protein